MTEIDIIIRLGVAVLCGLAIGLERERHKHPAGTRTFALVCLGSALAMVLQEWLPLSSDLGELVKVDLGRIPGQVVTGIGFIGAGLIMKNNDSVSGLTTAACIFLAAVVGLAVGGGMIWTGVGVTATAIILLVSSQVMKSKHKPRPVKNTDNK